MKQVKYQWNFGHTVTLGQSSSAPSSHTLACSYSYDSAW